MNKLIENVDNETWNIFVAKCRTDGVRVGHRINDLLEKFNRGELK